MSLTQISREISTRDYFVSLRSTALEAQGMSPKDAVKSAWRAWAAHHERILIASFEELAKLAAAFAEEEAILDRRKQREAVLGSAR